MISTRKFNPRSDWIHPRYKAALASEAVNGSQALRWVAIGHAC